MIASKAKLKPVRKSGFNKQRSRILIVDDHPLIRKGISTLIAQEPDLEICGEAADVSEALRQVKLTSPDVVLIDISLKNGHGIELIEQIKARNDQARMLVSSMYDEALYAERVMRAGAMGYINKQEATEKLVDAIRLVLDGQVYLSTQMTERMLHRVVDGRPLEDDPISRLSNRELEVFELIGRGLTTRQIAQNLCLSPKTIESHREKIKTKLALRNSTELSRRAVQWALEKG